MKKLFALVLAAGLGASFVGCTSSEPVKDKPKEPTTTPMTDPAKPMEDPAKPAEGAPAATTPPPAEGAPVEPAKP